MIKIEVANPSHVDGILALLRDFYFKESQYKNHFDFCEDATRTTINGWLEGLCFITKLDDEVIGVASIHFSKTYYKQVECDVDLFYVRPDCRGSNAARLMAETCIANAKANNAKGLYTGSLSNIGEKNHQLYVNLWGKFGITPLGTIMFGEI